MSDSTENTSEPRIREAERQRVTLAALTAEVHELSSRKFPWTWLIATGLTATLALGTAVSSILSQIQANNTDIKVLTASIESYKNSNSTQTLELKSYINKLEARIERLESKSGK